MEERELRMMVRKYEPEMDIAAVEDLENRCVIGSAAKMSLFTNLLGDPISRIRHSPSFLMLVAEKRPEKEIVGVIRGCIKTVTSCGENQIVRVQGSGDRPPEVISKPTKLGYILGLRVCPSHRRKGVGSKLVARMEAWFIENSVVYSYMATDNGNTPSLNLFTRKFLYSNFRTASILVQPVFAHRVKTHHRVCIVKLSVMDSEILYRRRFSTVDFFPCDVDRILQNNLNLGTYVAVPTGSYLAESWPGSNEFLSHPPESWAVLSVWNCKEAFTLEIKGASRARKIATKTTRVMDKAMPCLKIPSVPQVFRPFGLLFLYGLGGEGPRAAKMMKALSGHAHNMAMGMGCAVIVAEVAAEDPLKLAIPHWKMLSYAEDVWCIKRLVDDCSDGAVGDWTKSQPGRALFVDPREV